MDEPPLHTKFTSHSTIIGPISRVRARTRVRVRAYVLVSVYMLVCTWWRNVGLRDAHSSSKIHELFSGSRSHESTYTTVKSKKSSKHLCNSFWYFTTCFVNFGSLHFRTACLMHVMFSRTVYFETDGMYYIFFLTVYRVLLYSVCVEMFLRFYI